MTFYEGSKVVFAQTGMAEESHFRGSQFSTDKAMLGGMNETEKRMKLVEDEWYNDITIVGKFYYCQDPRPKLYYTSQQKG